MTDTHVAESKFALGIVSRHRTLNKKGNSTMTQSTKKVSDTGPWDGNIAPKKNLRTPRVNLKQWRMLHAVVECGSYANAAEFLRVSQPAISYAIGKLEEQLGVLLLKVEGRKAQITEPGSALLERSRFLLQEAVELEEFAENLRHGCGLEIRLAVDNAFPTRVLISALRRFSLSWQNAKVHLFEVSGTKIERVLHERGADLAINGQVPSGFHGDILISMEYVAVAHPDHPLFRLKRELIQADLDREVQVVLNSELATQIAEKCLGPRTTPQCWHVSNFDTAESVLCECLGYGWLPKHRMQKSLDEGKLKILPLREGTTYKANFYLVYGRPSALSSAVNRLAETLRSVAAENGNSLA